MLSLSSPGTLQKFVDDVFRSHSQHQASPPIAVRFFFDFLDDMAEKPASTTRDRTHLEDEQLSPSLPPCLPLRFWVNILKNPQFVFDVQVTDSVDAVLSVIAQTFIDSCTTSEHKVGRDSPVNKLLYAREIPRYKQLVERIITSLEEDTAGQKMQLAYRLQQVAALVENKQVAALVENHRTLQQRTRNTLIHFLMFIFFPGSRPPLDCNIVFPCLTFQSFGSDMNSLVALLELYKYINKYYDQIITSLEEDTAGQKMQLAYRLQQVAALVENKVTDL
ncbi:plexin-B1-like [Salvelinus sp. IW2-2015]|uniref:plexin-B1-like n=1 Tax=Salvelinus sp. IW2-2015 TaxID=2691554 RepID=UPI0038D366BA